MDRDEFILPKMKYLHEASMDELLDALEIKCAKFVFASVESSDDDRDAHIAHIVRYSGCKITALGLAEAARFELNCQIYRGDEVA